MQLTTNLIAWLLVICIIGVSIVVAEKVPNVVRYFVDEELLKIAQHRATVCGIPLSSTSNDASLVELRTLYNTSAGAYLRSHELFAFHYFVERRHQNAFYTSKWTDASLEYIPILTLHWRKHISGCDYKDLVQDLLAMHEYLTRRDAERSKQSKALPMRFMVSSTQNMRTMWGTGMPLQVRRGDAWQSISALTSSMALGHYERWPECPDLLRKQFKYLVELPFPDFSLPFQSSASTSTTTSRSGGKHSTPKTLLIAVIGDLELEGPEQVCAVRTHLIRAILQRNTHRKGRSLPTEDIVFVNLSSHALITRSVEAIHQQIAPTLSAAIFCLITPGTSYSSYMFSLAIQHHCIPVLVNDWLVPPFSFLLPYQTFSLRLLQEDFLHNIHFSLNYLTSLATSKSGLVDTLRENLRRFQRYLSWQPLAMTSTEYRQLLLLDHPNILSRSSGSTSITATSSLSKSSPHRKAEGVVPLDLLLLELFYASKPAREFYNNIPCERYYACEHRREVQLPAAASTPAGSSKTGRDYFFYDKPHHRPHGNVLSVSYLAAHLHDYWPSSTSSLASSISPITPSLWTPPLRADSYQIQAIDLQLLIKNLSIPATRSHLCVHHRRLIGTFKMVFFMQCVRVLWPLAPGEFRPVDRVERANETRWLGDLEMVDVDVGSEALAMVEVVKSSGAVQTTKTNGISAFERDFVLAFHNLQRPPHWQPSLYPAIPSLNGTHPALLTIH